MTKCLMKVVVGLLFVSSPAFAQWQGLVGKIGFNSGGIVLGAEYFVNDTASEGFAGYLSLHQKEERVGAPSLTAIGGAFKFTLQHGPYSAYLSPGFGIIDYELGANDGLLLGPKMSYGLLAELDRQTYLGVETEKLYSWVGDVEGLISDTFFITILMSI